VPTSGEDEPERLLEHAAWVKRLAARIVWDSASADDVAQETMVVALGAARPREPGRLRAWLAAIARNVVRRSRRSAMRREWRERVAASPESLEPTDEIVARASLQRAVVDAVLALAEPYRTTILMRFFDDLPSSTIASRRGEPLETVRTRLKRGLATLRAKLAKELEVETRDGAKRTGLGALAMLVEPGRAVVATSKLATAATLAAAAAVLATVSWTVLHLVARDREAAPHEDAASRASATGSTRSPTSQDGSSELADDSTHAGLAPLAANREVVDHVESPADRAERLRRELTLENLWTTKGVEQDVGPELRAAVQGLVKVDFDYGKLLDYLLERLDEGWVVRGSEFVCSGRAVGPGALLPSQSWVEAYENSRGGVSVAFVRVGSFDMELSLPLAAVMDELAPGVGFGDGKGAPDATSSPAPDPELLFDLPKPRNEAPNGAAESAQGRMGTSLEIRVFESPSSDSEHWNSAPSGSLRVNYVGVRDRRRLERCGLDGLLPIEVACTKDGAGTLEYYVSSITTSAEGPGAHRRFAEPAGRAITKHEIEAIADLHKFCERVGRNLVDEFVPRRSAAVAK
jgi:RNA polymerase sigma-70 factor (ECF subfamily)